MRSLFTWFYVLLNSVPKGMKEKFTQITFNELGLLSSISLYNFFTGIRF